MASREAAGPHKASRSGSTTANPQAILHVDHQGDLFCSLSESALRMAIKTFKQGRLLVDPVRTLPYHPTRRPDL